MKIIPSSLLSDVTYTATGSIPLSDIQNILQEICRNSDGKNEVVDSDIYFTQKSLTVNCQ